MPNDQQGYNATEAAIILLKDYRERKKEFHIFDDYDNAIKKKRDTTEANIADLDEPLKTIASRLFSALNKGFFLVLVCEWKLDYLAEALIQAIEAKNPLALANNVRGLVEHLAALVAIINELDRLNENLRGKNQEKGINEALEKTEKFIHRAYYGKSPKITNIKNKQALHINDCIKAMEQHVDDIEEVYDFLCEYVHPNYGSNLLVSTGQLGSGKLNPPEDFHRETLDRLKRYCSLCMLFLKEKSIGFASVFSRLNGLLELCFIKGAKITNVFSIKSPKPEGDGKSKETAFFFPKARTHMEVMELCYRFLEENGYEMQNQRIGDMADGFIYDVLSTDKGSVWFKIPIPKLS